MKEIKPAAPVQSAPASATAAAGGAAAPGHSPPQVSAVGAAYSATAP